MRLIILLTFGVALLSGCATTEPLATYFILAPEGGSANAARPGAIRVYVRRVEVPAYLNRRSLASMNGTEIRYSPTNLWALPLDQTIAVGVAGNLSRASIPALGFQPLAAPPAHPYEVVIRISHFEGHENGDVVLSGTWRLTTPGGDTIRMKSVVIHRSGWQPGNDVQLVNLLREEVAELSAEIASALRGR